MDSYKNFHTFNLNHLSPHRAILSWYQCNSPQSQLISMGSTYQLGQLLAYHDNTRTGQLPRNINLRVFCFPKHETGWPRHREFGCSFLPDKETTRHLPKIFKIWLYTGNLTPTQGNISGLWWDVATILTFWSKCWVGGRVQTKNGVTFFQQTPLYL